jgi:integrase/recombinase XerD
MSRRSARSSVPQFISGKRLRILVARRWRRQGYARGTVRGYLVWVRRHQEGCASAGLDEVAELTRARVVGLAQRHGRRLGLPRPRAFLAAHSALRAWSSTLAALGFRVPEWAPPPKPSPFSEVIRYWGEKGYSEGTIRGYLVWLKRYRAHFGTTTGRDRLTRRDVLHFARRCAHRHNISPATAVRRSVSALRAFSRALAALGEEVPPWRPSKRPGAFEALLLEYRCFRTRLRGVRASSLDIECRHARDFLRWLRRRGRLSSITPRHVDRFVISVGARVLPCTLSSRCSSLRSFLRFLHATGRTPVNLAAHVQGPRLSRTANLPRGLPWADVRRVLGAIDQTTLLGKRDYAAFLLMASYGMGISEVLGLRLDQIDWHQGTLVTTRAKTGVVTILPLLGPVGDALASYLRSGPPRHPSVRAVFLRSAAPQAPLRPAGLRQRFVSYAVAAGIGPTGNTHALRHR